MKTYLPLVLLAASLAGAFAGSTIDPNNRFAYGANAGWMNWRGDGVNGAAIGQYVCSGSIYAANVGWISLGGRQPDDASPYQNTSGDYGVNVGSQGELRGFAWGANIGWVVFEPAGAPKVDLNTGTFSGYAWSANCGWIGLTNAQAFVQTDSVIPALRITAYTFGPDGRTVTLTWTSSPTRHYYIQKTPVLVPPSWTDSGLGIIAGDSGASTTRSFLDSAAPMRFYRIKGAP